MKKNRTVFSKIYSKVAVLFIIALLFVLVFKVLHDGIKINSISVAGVKIDGLYLKLDKKLILIINNLDVSKMDSGAESTIPSIKEVTDIIRKAVMVSKLFERLEIVNIQHESESYSILFDGTQYNINIPQILALFRLENDGDDILLNIETLKIKNEVDIRGKALFVNKGRILAFDLDSHINENDVIHYQGETNFKYLSVVMDSTKLDSIDVLAPYIKLLDTNVYEWIYERTAFEKVTLNRAHIFIENLKSKHIEQDIIDNLYASGIVENVSLRFDDGLSPITTDMVAVLFNKGKLTFQTQNASYDGIIADKGIVTIQNFLANQPLLHIDITAKNAIFDERISGILSNYGVNIPVTQTEGIAAGNIKLDILLPTKGFKAHVTPHGAFHVSDSYIQINGVEVYVKEGNLEIDKDNVYVKDSVAYFRDIVETNINLEVDTQNQTINIHALPSRFVLENNDVQILDFSNQTIDVSLDFSGETLIADIEQYGVHIEAGEYVTIRANDIHSILPHAPLLQLLAIEYGNLEIITKDFETIVLNANIKNLKYPIYNMNKTDINALSIQCEITPRRILISEPHNRIKTQINTRSGNVDLWLEELFVNIDDILDSDIPIFANLGNKYAANPAASPADSTSNILINAKNVKLALFGHDMFFEESMLKTTQDGFIGNGRHKNGIANIISNQNGITIEASNFNDEAVNNIFGSNIISGGTFGINGIYRDKKFLGDIHALDTSVTNMASLQNILTLIDTIPSLLVFKLPGFSTSGYEVEDARIRVGYSEGFVALEKIDVIGSSVDIQGQGVIDATTRELDINLGLSTIKGLSSIVSKIPLVGYIILGDDGKISTKLKISGTIDDPQSELSLLDDTVSAPVDMVERIFSPFKILVDELEKESKSTDARDRKRRR